MGSKPVQYYYNFLIRSFGNDLSILDIGISDIDLV
jgi:hypothetical protein